MSRPRRARSGALTGTAPVQMWLAAPLTPDVQAVVERVARAADVQRIALLPDVHLARGVCVGMAVATSRLIYPQAVGADVGCGMAALALDAPAELLADEAAARAVLAGLRAAVPVLRQRSLQESPTWPASLADLPPSTPQLAAAAARAGRVEFATLGRGNHFLELQADVDGRLWLMVHSGSRCMGQLITDWHAQHATRAAGGLFHLEAESPAGQAYLADVAWARAYADASRRAMLATAAELLHRLFGTRAVPDSLVACDHDHVQREAHFGTAYWVHRKGANAAADGAPGIIPGSMGTASYHVRGRGCPAALCSSSHGAGRAMSRDQARRQIAPRHLQRQLAGIWFDDERMSRLCEEAPAAYKDIAAVMRAQRALVKIERVLHPVLCYRGV